jgi:endothelin-converting enzyme/putative endopeptidase
MKSNFTLIIAFGMAMMAFKANASSHATPDTNAIQTANQSSTSSENSNKATFGNWGVETQRISKSIKPGDDFFSYVNEGWIKSTKIPSGYWDYGQTSVLAAQTEQRVRDIVHAAAQASAPKGDPRQQVGDLYSSFMDTDRIERLGLSPIQSDLNSIVTIKTHEEVARWMADPRSSSLVAINVFPDAGNTKRWLVHLDQGNLVQPILGLPRREYYERKDGAFPADRVAYREYVTKVFERTGIDRAAQRANDVLALETKLAALQWNLEQLRDRKANYHLLSVRELMAYTPGFPWSAFLTARQVGDVEEVVLGTDTAVQAQAKVFRETPVDQWSSYLAFHWIQNQVDLLPSAFQSASFDFYGKRLSGQKEQSPRDQRAISFANSRMAQVVGRLYVERYFSQETLTRAVELFDYLRRAFGERLATVDWMDEQTRAEAQSKLAAFKFKIGYPRKWRDYSHVSIRQDDLMGNARRLQKADWSYARSMLKGRNKKEVWYQSPQVVDASFGVLFNAVELPAAFLQPPYFDPLADPAVNFGSIGAIIGHEMGHGFDDQGAHFDGKGRLRDWWTEDSRIHFKERTDALVGQYSAFSPIEGLYLNGKLTLGENIGDLTGVSLAYRAYQLYLHDHPEMKGTVRDGFTNDQRFFLSWGQAWRYIAPDSAIRYIIENGYHSPAPYRVNGVVRNIDAWYDAFGVTPGQRLYLSPSERVKLW